MYSKLIFILCCLHYFGNKREKRQYFLQEETERIICERGGVYKGDNNNNKSNKIKRLYFEGKAPAIFKACSKSSKRSSASSIPTHKRIKSSGNSLSARI